PLSLNNISTNSKAILLFPSTKGESGLKEVKEWIKKKVKSK
ncbi:unnamed protein product, partial [marine sediment metagenome]